MLGAIYGDKAGSIYEYEQSRKVKRIEPSVLITDNSFYSDDTIETIALIDAITSNEDYEKILKEYILKYENYRPDYQPYFKTAFSPNTLKWAKGGKNNNSTGNGAMMRISPVGYLFDTERDVVNNAILATTPSHNSFEAIYSSEIIALMIFYFRCGYTKEQIYKKLNLKIEYVPFTNFNRTCSETLYNCLYAIYMSDSFESAIRIILSMGGDTDTNACIVGSVAEAMYGMNEEQKNDAQKNLPDEFKKVLKRVY